MAANPHYAEGEVIANKYVVEGLIGESPAARTFLANGSVGKLAVKIYRPEVSARLLAAPDFFLKAFVVTEIEHDNLCGCIDVQEEMGLVFVARAFTEGQSFEDWIRSHRTAGNYYSRGMELLWQTCQGLTALHERTRHLDIHPGNVIVGPIVAKLCDWDPRALGNMEMTPDILPVRSEYQGYRAPEAAGRGGFLSYPSTDLFAVAGMLYRLVKGDHPSVNPAQTLGEIRSFDKDVAVFLTKAMHPKPEERFQDAGAFSDALWELQGAMQRLQERGVRAGTQSTPKPVPQLAPPKDDFMFPDPPVASPNNGFADIPAGKEPTFPGAPAAVPENDSFFNFFPPADAAPAVGNPDQARKLPQPSEPKSSGDTLFGAPSSQDPHNEPIRPKRENPAYVPPRQESNYTQPAPSGGLSDLEIPGTLFGAQAPLFSSPAPKPSRNESPAPAKPLAVSLSSLEKDPLEMAGSNEPGGFTAYGFKGAGDNRTGIYESPEVKAAAAKTKLMILLGTAGGLILVVGLVGLFIFLRSNAAHKEEASAESTPAFDQSPAPELAPEPAPEPANRIAPEPAHTETPAIPEPKKQPEPVAATQPSSKVPDASQGYSEPPMPVEPLRPGAPAVESRPAPPGPRTSSAPQTVNAPAYKGNNHVSPEREAALMAMVQTRVWPNSASERIKAADDLNDLGKTAEANLAYAKALGALDVTEKQKVLALGGLAVTFQAMGMRDQARDAVQKILGINPKNGFALKLKEKLR